MANNQIEQTVPLKSIVVDKDIYPREKHSWHRAYEYSQAMNSGSVFPKIVLGLFKNKLYLIDGMHRMEAMKMNKEVEIKSLILHGLTLHEMFKKAIKMNVAHGYSLSVYDKRRAALRLFKMGIGTTEVSSLINVPTDKLETFVQQRMVNTITGKESTQDFTEIGNEILKTVLKHQVGSAGQEAIESLELQKKIGTATQLGLWRETAFLLENHQVDNTNKEIVKLFLKTKRLIKDYKF